MPDNIAKKQLIQLIHQLVADPVTNVELINSLANFKRKKFGEVFVKGIWPFYNELYSHNLFRQQQVALGSKSLITRIMLFLYADKPYKWPIIKKRFDVCFMVAMILPLLLLKLSMVYWIPLVVLFSVLWVNVKKTWWRWLTKKSKGDLAVWPFFTQQEYDYVLANPALLANGEIKPQ